MPLPQMGTATHGMTLPSSLASRRIAIGLAPRPARRPFPARQPEIGSMSPRLTRYLRIGVLVLAPLTVIIAAEMPR
jgi:hypothetical protein